MPLFLISLPIIPIDRMWHVPLYLTIIEFGVGAATLLSLGLFLLVLKQYQILHPNCRFLLVCLAVALVSLTSVYMVELSAVVENVTLPERGDTVNHPYLRNIWFLHETFYALTSLLMFCLTLERFYACIYAERYGMSQKFCLISILAVVLSVIGSMTFGYYIHFRDIHIPTTSIINSFEICSLFLSLFTLFWSRRQYRSMENVNLNYRYQMVEVINLTKCIIPAIMLGVFFKLAAMFFVWRMIFLDMDPVCYSEIVSAYGLLFPWVVMIRHDRMRTTLYHLLPGCGDAKARRIEKETLKSVERLTKPYATQDEYFSVLGVFLGTPEKTKFKTINNTPYAV
ncbi:hypothetical protein PRIPAC_97603 [Pristionchus pacificus]|uniref:Uncharacterized protein n=1 Tax=Pristionchus pacificus TaxID=54126 RepID=A0A2A6D117_PRIPA|nr:hypothetical protein PRIPAC_97603 [Pristionchus pacificus]|eukprot:PDM84079.1 hypothetical protein PRIPAC_34271 [Pristionchus pacificus]